MNFPKLNLPAYPLHVRQNPNQGFVEILCTQRHKWVKLTPEEWVRQNFVQHLINDLGFPSGRIGNEICIKVGQLERRCDSVVFDENGNPVVIVEYKATTVPLTQKVFDQIVRYNVALRVQWLMVSNGLQHYCCHLNPETLQFEFLREFPRWNQI